MMLQLKKLCKECKKPLDEVSSKVIGDIKVIHTKCGHVLFEKILLNDPTSIDNVISEDGRKLRPFQKKRIDDVLNSDVRCLLNQEVGLGKTVIAAGTLKLHFDELKPILIICKAGLKTQIFWEIHRWIGKRDEKGEWEGVISQVIDESKDRPQLKFFKVVIISFETLSRAKWVDDPDFVGAFKTIVIDECQKIKSPGAAMTGAVRKLCSGTILVKRDFVDRINREKIMMIAKDLMKLHGVDKTFKIHFSTFGSVHRFGQTEIKIDKKEGQVVGRIVLDRDHCENDSESEIIDTILHEIAHAMTPGAGHNTYWRQMAESIGAKPYARGECDGTIPINDSREVPKHIIATSATPIKNSAREYFTILNILKPERFRVKEYFEKEFVEQIWTGTTYKAGGIKKGSLVRWKQITEDFIFRDTRAEVAPEIPAVDRQFRYSVLEKEVETAYLNKLKQFTEEFGNEDMDSIKGKDWGNVLTYINEMRQITGMAKTIPCTEYVEEFLEGSEEDKIVIFVHHIQAGNVLRIKLTKAISEGSLGNSPLSLTSDLNSEERQEVIEKFRNDPKNRVLIASTQAAGEGLNLQFCSNCVLMERQWNPANEEQAEGRFTRIGSTANSVIAMYLVALGTIDEFFATLVENKRTYMKSALDGEHTSADDSPLMRGLAKKLIESGRSKWKLLK